MPYLSCKKIENDVYNFPTWQYCKYKDIFDSRIIINSTAKFYISISYQKDLLSIDTRIFTPSYWTKRTPGMASVIKPECLYQKLLAKYLLTFDQFFFFFLTLTQKKSSEFFMNPWFFFIGYALTRPFSFPFRKAISILICNIFF